MFSIGIYIFSLLLTFCFFYHRYHNSLLASLIWKLSEVVICILQVGYQWHGIVVWRSSISSFIRKLGQLTQLCWFFCFRYPIYRIPVGTTLKDLDACFLTFHSLHTHLLGSWKILCSSFLFSIQETLTFAFCEFFFYIARYKVNIFWSILFWIPVNIFLIFLQLLLFIP